MESAATILTLNPSTLQLGGSLGRIDLSDFECRLLRAFAESIGYRLETADLKAIDSQPDMLGKRTLEVRLVRLRKKLEQVGAPAPTIKSIRGVGYQLCVPLAISASHPLIQGKGTS